MVHDMYIAEVKSPQQSKKPWDYYTIKQTIPAQDAFAPLSASHCPLVPRSDRITESRRERRCREPSAKGAIMKAITFNIEGRNGGIERTISIDTLVIAGWTGRDTVAMEKHIRELEELGIKRPAYTPVFYRVAADRLGRRDR